LRRPISALQRARIAQEARRRAGIFYDTGFDLRSRRQFCSRFVREVIADSAGIELGAVETFAALFQQRPDSTLGFWKLWFFGRIPWERETVTPASLLASPRLRLVFDGRAGPASP
jgi:hypothetical protein